MTDRRAWRARLADEAYVADLKARAESAEAEVEALREEREHLLHGICDALDVGKPTEPILRALLKDTEHEHHRSTKKGSE